MQEDRDVFSLTRKLLSFNTINPPGQEHDCAKYIGKLLEDGGFKVSYYEFAPGRTSLVAMMEGSRNKLPICFTGHIDTVSLGDTAWKKDPFSGDIEGDNIYGRGSTDMKGGVAVMAQKLLNGEYTYRQKLHGSDIGFGTFYFKDNVLIERTWSGCSRPLELNPEFKALFTVNGSQITGSSQVCCNCSGLGPWTQYEYTLNIVGEGKLYGNSIGKYKDGTTKEYTIGLIHTEAKGIK